MKRESETRFLLRSAPPPPHPHPITQQGPRTHISIIFKQNKRRVERRRRSICRLCKSATKSPATVEPTASFVLLGAERGRKINSINLVSGFSLSESSFVATTRLPLAASSVKKEIEKAPFAMSFVPVVLQGQEVKRENRRTR